MTSRQKQKLEDVAGRFGCWPDDTRFEYLGENVDATIGEAKGRPKRVVIKPNGRVLNREEVARLVAR